MKLSWNRSLLLLAALGIAMYAAVIGASTKLDRDGTTAAEPSINKREAAAAALAFVKMRFGMENADTFVTFQTRKLRSSYLERRKLAKAYEKQFGEKYPLDYFSVELRNKKSGEHRFVDIDFTNKRILGWTVAEGDKGTRDGPKLDRGQAEAVAHSALKEQGYDASDFTLIDIKEQPKTLFVYESKTAAIGEAKLQVEIDADEREAFGFAAVFVIPQEHVKWLNKQDSQASIMTWASLGFMFLMAVAGFIYAVLYRKQLSFARGAVLSIIYVVFYCVNNLNMLPALKAEQGSAATAWSTVFTVLFVNFVTLLMAAGVYVSYVSGVELWRRYGWNPWPRWRDEKFGAEVWAAMGRGYLICLFALGVQQVLFFVAEYGFGVWAVGDVSSSPYNLLVPGLFPLLAWCAAISEESTFRLFGIAFFGKMIKWRFAAVLLPSIIWAASHTQYPIYPVYTRLVEVTVLGIIFGYVFLKYGFMTVLFAHATMDSLLMGLDLFSLHDVSDTLLGAFYMASPLLVGWGLMWLHGRSLRSRIVDTGGGGLSG